jgi:choline dehydrogenase
VTYIYIYRSIPQKKSNFGANDQIRTLPAGRVLGGSSSINTLIYVRPAKEDLNRWEQKYGCTGWGYADMLPIMKRIEDAGSSIASHPLRNRGGTMAVQRVSDSSQNAEWFIEAAKKHGFKFSDDYNADTLEGISFTQHSQKRGRRWSTVHGYLL